MGIGKRKIYLKGGGEKKEQKQKQKQKDTFPFLLNIHPSLCYRLTLEGAFFSQVSSGAVFDEISEKLSVWHRHPPNTHLHAVLYVSLQYINSVNVVCG
jgi:hypothetical protein